MTGLRIECRLPAPPERVFVSLTDPDALAAWFWPPDFGTTVTADAHPGGRYRIAGAGPMGQLAVEGRYTIVQPPDRLAFTWRWEGDGAETLVTIELAAVGDGTTLTLTHDGLKPGSDHDNHVTGWSDCFGRLPTWLAA